MKIPYFDAHCDTALPVYDHGKSIYRNNFHIDLERLGAYSPAVQVFAICAAHREGMVEKTEWVMDEFIRQLGLHRDKVMLCLSAADIDEAEKQGKVGVLISVEGAEKLGCSIEKLRSAYNKGLRIVHLTWNHPNILSGTCVDGGGLTEKGREFVIAAQEMGVALDMSHISEKAFWDIQEIATKPVLAGHSNSKTVCDHIRNLTDEQFKALVKTGGAAGLNMYLDILGHGRDVDAVLAHAEHFLSLGGEKTLCLGGDLDGIPEMPKGMKGVQDMAKLYEAMLARNWSEDLVRDIFYRNLRSFMERAI